MTRKSYLLKIAYNDEPFAVGSRQYAETPDAAAALAFQDLWNVSPKDGSTSGMAKVVDTDTGAVVFLSIQVLLESKAMVTHRITVLDDAERIAQLEARDFSEACGRIPPDWDPPMPTRAPTILASVTPEELELLLDALGSHIYWQVSDLRYRHDANVRDPGSDDPEKQQAYRQARALEEKLEQLRPRSSQVVDDDDFTSGGGGDFTWKYRGKGYLHASAVGAELCVCGANRAVAACGDFAGVPERVLPMTAPYEEITCPGCRHILGIEPCGQHPWPVVDRA